MNEADQLIRNANNLYFKVAFPWWYRFTMIFGVIGFFVLFYFIFA